MVENVKGIRLLLSSVENARVNAANANSSAHHTRQRMDALEGVVASQAQLIARLQSSLQQLSARLDSLEERGA